MSTVKRANGLGSMRYDAERKRYELRITVDGERYKVTGRTQTEVEERADRKRAALMAGPGLPAEVTVQRWLNHWVTEVLPLADVAQSTAESYAGIVRLYVLPHIGRVRLDQLAPSHVRTMLTRLRAEGLSPNTVRLARSTLRRALRTAEVDGLISRNPAALVDGVKITQRKEGRTLTPEQARALLRAADGTEIHALVVVLLSLGLRKGEALALSWADLDLDARPGLLTVRRALKKDASGAVYADEPKTKGSRRTVHLPEPVVDVLRQHRVRQAEQRLAFGEGWGGKWATLDLVFTSSIGTPLDPDRVNRDVQRLTDLAGLGRWTPHELRHSAASILLAQGVPLKVVSETLGHSSIRVTADVYGHLMEPAKAEAAEAMTSALWG